MRGQGPERVAADRPFWRKLCTRPTWRHLGQNLVVLLELLIATNTRVWTGLRPAPLVAAVVPHKGLAPKKLAL